MSGAGARRESTGVTLARIEERLKVVEGVVQNLQEFLRTDYLKHLEEKVTKLEKHNEEQDVRIEAHMKVLWKWQGMWYGAFVLINVAVSVWRALNG